MKKMPDPTTGSFLGVKYASVIAGLAGGIVSLTYLRNLTKWQAALAVITGAAVAGYGTPLAVHFVSYFFGSVSIEAESSLAFLLGLISMNVVPGIMRLSEIFKRDPEKFVRLGKGDDHDARRPSDKPRRQGREEIDFPTLDKNMRRKRDADRAE